jgi:phosphoglycolate phosphatase-like HAD superfamily hydrolase
MASHRTYTKEDLINLKPAHSSFVGIDSDGCVFPTMEIKQKKCFHTVIVSHWHFEPIEKYVRETAEFVNLYSQARGANRFIAILKVFDLLRARPAVRASGVDVPDLKSLRAFIDSGVALGHPQFEKAVQETGDKELASLLQWSKDVNALVAKIVRNVPPFKWAPESLALIHAQSDAICVSQTPTEAIVREWEENGLAGFVTVVAGQELGTKTEHISMATKGRYRPDRILMIGDAMGDKKAAKENNAFFYPIDPGHEEASWKRFHDEAYGKFLAATYGGKYEEDLTAEFDSLLPENPSWKD